MIAPEQLTVSAERLERVAQWAGANLRSVVLAEHSSHFAPTSARGIELRDYQIEAVAKLGLWRELGGRRALGDVATGLGKTLVAAVDVMQYREEYEERYPGMRPRVLFVSKSHEINEQAANTFSKIMPDAHIAFYETRRPYLPVDEITFATIRALYNEHRRFHPRFFQYILWEESHHTEAPTYRTVRRYFDPDFEHAITGTVERMDGKDIRIYFGKPLYQKDLASGIAEGRLARVDYHLVLDDAVKELITSGFRPKTLKEFKGLLAAQPRNEVIALNIRVEQLRIGLGRVQTIVFCNSIKHAEEMAALLGGAAYHSGLTRLKRQRILANYRAGRNWTLCTVDVCNEGLDLPDVGMLVFLRSTQSDRIFKQQLGRGLRGDKVTILDFAANIERILAVRDLGWSVQWHANELAQRKEDQQVSRSKESDGGLHIHTPHGDFMFEELAVKLLEQYDRISSREADAITNDDLVAWALSKKPDGPLRRVEIIKLCENGQEGPINYRLICRRFGSPQNFHRACGFEPLPSLSGKTDDEIREIIIQKALQLKPDGPLLSSEISTHAQGRSFFSLTIIRKYFGSVPNFQNTCGFKPVDKRRKSGATPDEARANIVRQALEIRPDGLLLTSEIKALAKEGKFVGWKSILKYFDSIANFHEACAREAAAQKPHDQTGTE